MRNHARRPTWAQTSPIVALRPMTDCPMETVSSPLTMGVARLVVSPVPSVLE